MKTIYIYTIASLLLIAGCTNSLYKKGVKHYEKAEYAEAIPKLEKYLAKKDGSYDAMVKLADSYRHKNDIPNAEKWYSKVVILPESEPINKFYYGRVLMELGRYDEAARWFDSYLLDVDDDIVAEMLLVSCRSISEHKMDTTLYTIKEAEIPEVATAFGEVPYGKGIIFTADKISFKNSSTYNWTGRSYLDLYYSQKDDNGKWMNPGILKGNINGQYHEGPATFNQRGDVVYFTRSNYKKKKKLNKDEKNESNLKIYRAELVGDNFTNIKEFPYNNDDYSCGHPSLSSDEKTLYFISDMPGGMGGTDIYKCVWDGSNWGKPENLGNIINTPGNEMFPYIHQDGTLYFSSDAHNSLGGLDVFMSYFDGTKWLQVENLNYPLNTSYDDFAFVLNEDNKTGYVSSDRNNGTDKIFEVTKNDPTFLLSGNVVRKGLPISGIDSAVVEIQNMTENTKSLVITDKKGKYQYKFKPNCDYVVKAWKPMYFTVSSEKKFSMKGKKVSENFTADFVLDQIIIEKPIVLENIYYDLDKWFIRPDAAKELDKLVQIMKDNPDLQIELSSHTDSRAGDQYNLILSDKRAKAAVDYLVFRGISAKRMTWKGYGETRLVNRCKNGVECTEVEHQQNRRTEFKAIKVSKNNSIGIK